MTPAITLNWREIELLVAAIRAELRLETDGVFVERIVVPDRPRFPGGYVKGEWALKLRQRREDHWLVLSARPRRPYLALYPFKGIRNSQSATRSPFDLEVSRHLKDSRLLGIETPPRERIVLLRLSSDRPGRELGLAMLLIPATPEALLLERDGKGPWKILTSTKKGRTGEFAPPSGSQAPESPPVREATGIATKPESYFERVDTELDSEAFELRLRAAERGAREVLKQAKERKRQSEVSLTEARAEADWRSYGELLKATLPGAPALEHDPKGKPPYFRRVKDFESDKEVLVPGDPRFEAREQVERFFNHGRRKQRRIEEAELRISSFDEAIARAEKRLAKPPAEGDWASLEAFERAGGLGPVSTPVLEKRKKTGKWLGKSFESRDGLPIWVGRSKDENLELTFKHTRGNDVWLHVRGRPGSHVVVPLSSGKSPPLETLLDAATLAIYYSGGEHWGKTEVDYTYKKYVKRIKDSTEASYTHNKTLTIDPDPARIKRLLGSE